VLTEGLVTEDRRRKQPVWDLMGRIFLQIDAGPPPEGPAATYARVNPAAAFPADLVPLDLTSTTQGAGQQQAWQVVAPGYVEWPSLPDSLPAGACRLAQAATGKPLLLSAHSPRVRLDVRRHISQVWLLGLGTLTAGYPVGGQVGDRVARLGVGGHDGIQELWLCLGRHVARQNAVYQGSRIDPVTLDAPLLFEWIVDPDADVRRVRVYAWHLPRPQDCAYLDLERLDMQAALVVHAISVR
jgi:hypothetical protein